MAKCKSRHALAFFQYRCNLESQCDDKCLLKTMFSGRVATIAKSVDAATVLYENTIIKRKKDKKHNTSIASDEKVIEVVPE